MTNTDYSDTHKPELGSVSRLIHQFKDGSGHALSMLWHKYQPRLIKVARKFLLSSPKRLADEEDAASSAFASFVRRTQAGSYADLVDREQLWQILVFLTRNKSSIQIRTERRKGCKPLRTVLDGGEDLRDVFYDVASSEPSPTSTAEFLDLIGLLLSRLFDPELRSIAVAKLNGFSNSEIATKLNRSVPTIERRLKLIRTVWQEQFSNNVKYQ